jgi:hypothetical protein
MNQLVRRSRDKMPPTARPYFAVTSIARRTEMKAREHVWVARFMTGSRCRNFHESRGPKRHSKDVQRDTPYIRETPEGLVPD